MTTEITIPNNWVPMEHQLPVWSAMSQGVRRALLCWHRRAGKDSFAVNFLAYKAMTDKGVYWHMLPTATQARKIIWNGLDRYGRRVIDQAFPPAIRKRTRDDEMLIELTNGAIIQLVGSDNFDNLVGANPKGVVFSEFAISNPLAWDYIRPMLAENNGFAIFISTPRGRNHFYKLYDLNNESSNWFCEVRDITRTYREDGSPIITEDVLEEERRSGMEESKIQQEYFCSWEGGLEGAYFTEEVNDIRNNRLNHYVNDDSMAMTAWDIGISDKTAIGVFKRHPETGYPILMDAYEDRNKGLAYYIRRVSQWQRDFMFSYHTGPHDLHKTEFTNNMRIVDRAADMGINFDVLPRGDRASEIDNLRAFLKVLHVNDNDNTRHVLDMLQMYRRKFDEKNQRFMDEPVKDFSTDSVDMMRYASIGYDGTLLQPTYMRRKITAKRAIGN